MTGPKDWPLLRPVVRGKHRTTPPVIKEPVLTPGSLAASLPGAMPRPLTQPNATIATAAEAPPEPDKIVQCGFCFVLGPSSLIPDLEGSRGPRCTDDEACVKRWAEEGQPRPLVTFPVTAPEPLPRREPAASFVAEPLPQPEEAVPSDEAIDAHLEAFNAAHDEQDEAEADPLPRDYRTDIPFTPETLREHVEDLGGTFTAPDDLNVPAEPRTEDEEPAADSAPAPVAEGDAPTEGEASDG